LNKHYLSHHHIHLLPPISPPPALYHHKPNFNFTFLTTHHPNTFHNFNKFTDPILQALQSIPLHPQITPPNHIQLRTPKISPNPILNLKNRIFSHPTLMLNS
ncbi:lipoyl protein ligase domain-containing protein, partial [Staphylococcus hominis]